MITRPIPILTNAGNDCFISSTMWALSSILYRDIHFFDVFENNKDNLLLHF